MDPVFTLVPGGALDRRLDAGPDWALVPLRIPTGWSVRWNGFDARRLASGQVVFSDSEDLLWLTTLPPPGGAPGSTDPASRWREQHLDLGWYRDHFRLVHLDPDWDHVAHTFETVDPEALLARLERWLLRVSAGLDPDAA